MNRPPLSPPAALVWDPALLEFRFGDRHPMDPARLELTERLCAELGLLEKVTTIAPAPASTDQLRTIHTEAYLAAVEAAGRDGAGSRAHGLGTEDNPVFEAMHTGAALIAGGTAALAGQVASGSITRGVNFAGGMHHAQAGSAGGFCVYNDVALAVRILLDGGISRVACIDLDAHHGDGTQQIFYDDPRVMTISLHQSGANLFPFSGYPNETGSGDAAGTSVNVSLPEETGDAGFLRAFDATVPALLEAFAPEVIISQHGADAHARDPLSDLQMSIEGQRQLALAVGELADRHCGGRWIATGGGGYAVFDVVPRTWAHLTAIVAGDPLPPEAPTPSAWQAEVESRGTAAPQTMGDGVDPVFRSWSEGYDPEDDADRAVIQTRKEIFPFWGLDPHYD